MKTVVFLLVLSLALSGRPFAERLSNIRTDRREESFCSAEINHVRLDCAHLVTLPDGAVYCSLQPAINLPDLDLSLEIIAVKKDLHPAAKLSSTVGNHAAVLTQEQVLTPEGLATLAWVERTPPAAARADTATYEYWVIVFRDYPKRPDMVLAYTINGVITGGFKEARRQILEVAKTWKIAQPASGTDASGAECRGIQPLFYEWKSFVTGKTFREAGKAGSDSPPFGPRPRHLK